MNWYLQVLKRYAEFGGRSSRSEYWYYTLFNILILIGLFTIGFMVKALMVLYLLYSLGVLIPGIAVSIRRLHDVGKSGLWLLIIFVPILGGLYLLYLMVQPSQSGSNAFGSLPN